MFNKIKKGFTLAEVLITLVIIGIVAALTIPTAIAKYRKTETVTRLKKTYSTLAQATSRIIAEVGSPNASIGGWCSSQDNMYKMYKKYLQNAKDCGSAAGCFENTDYIGLDGQATEGWNLYSLTWVKKFILSDGIQVLLFTDNDGFSCNINRWGSKNACGNIMVDINGSKKPNQIGRDLFFFELKEDGLHPTGCDLDNCSGRYAYGCACKVLRENAINY